MAEKVLPEGIPFRTWISINQKRDLVEEMVYEDVQENIVNIFIITFLWVILAFLFIGIISLVTLKCVFYFRQVMYCNQIQVLSNILQRLKLACAKIEVLRQTWTISRSFLIFLSTFIVKVDEIEIIHSAPMANLMNLQKTWKMLR